MWEIPSGHPLQRLFAGLTEYTFHSTLGVADPPLVDYLTHLLTRFVHSDATLRLRGADGMILTTVLDMLAEANKLPDQGVTHREYHRHIGDCALFWTGVFPESVRSQTPAVNLAQVGKRCYLVASRFEGEAYRNEGPVLRRLSEQFELCAYGLSEVRREWEVWGQSPPPPGALIH
jgi:hypothetical protein